MQMISATLFRTAHFTIVERLKFLNGADRYTIILAMPRFIFVLFADPESDVLW